MSEKIKMKQAAFTTLFLAMQNALGGSPSSLLRNQNATDSILKAQDELTQMLLIAAECHDVEMHFQEDYDSHLIEEIDKLKGDIKLLTTDKEMLQNEVEYLKAENAKLKKSKSSKDKKDKAKETPELNGEQLAHDSDSSSVDIVEPSQEPEQSQSTDS
jgi:FtsZ-binding cell division protein ZapB